MKHYEATLTQLSSWKSRKLFEHHVITKEIKKMVFWELKQLAKIWNLPGLFNQWLKEITQ